MAAPTVRTGEAIENNPLPVGYAIVFEQESVVLNHIMVGAVLGSANGNEIGSSGAAVGSAMATHWTGLAVAAVSPYKSMDIISLSGDHSYDVTSIHCTME